MLVHPFSVYLDFGLTGSSSVLVLVDKKFLYYWKEGFGLQGLRSLLLVAWRLSTIGSTERLCFKSCGFGSLCSCFQQQRLTSPPFLLYWCRWSRDMFSPWRLCAFLFLFFDGGSRDLQVDISAVLGSFSTRNCGCFPLFFASMFFVISKGLYVFMLNAPLGALVLEAIFLVAVAPTRRCSGLYPVG